MLLTLKHQGLSTKPVQNGTIAYWSAIEMFSNNDRRTTGVFLEGLMS